MSGTTRQLVVVMNLLRTRGQRRKDKGQGMAELLGGGTPAPPAPAAACEETYGLFPCSTSLGGTVILIFVYGQALLVGE